MKEEENLEIIEITEIARDAITETIISIEIIEETIKIKSLKEGGNSHVDA